MTVSDGLVWFRPMTFGPSTESLGQHRLTAVSWYVLPGGGYGGTTK